MGNKNILIPAKPPTSYHFGYVVNISFIVEWCDSIFANYDKMARYITFSAPLLRSLLPLVIKHFFR